MSLETDFRSLHMPQIYEETKVLDWECFQRPNGSSLGPGFIGLGNSAIVLEEGGIALKIPKLRNLRYVTGRTYDNLVFKNEMNEEKLLNEVSIFERLGSHPNIIKCIQVSNNGIKLPLFKRGNLCSYIRRKENRPPLSLAAKWVRSIVDAICHCHERRVFLVDIALRNILIADDDSLVMIDFADSTMFPLDTDMEHAVDGDINAQTEIFHFAHVALSVLTWQESEYDLYSTPLGQESSRNPFTIKWPPLEALPCTTDIPYGDVIRKCWIQGAYRSMCQVREDLSEVAESSQTRLMAPVAHNTV